MIVGTTRPQRWQENARYVAEGNLSNEEYEAIRNRCREVAGRKLGRYDIKIFTLRSLRIKCRIST
jgi:hypothetical protein